MGIRSTHTIMGTATELSDANYILYSNQVAIETDTYLWKIGDGQTAFNSLGYAGSLIGGYTTTATAAGSTTLTVASKVNQFFSGTTTQTIVLPVTSTLTLGQKFNIVNSSTGALTVNSSGSNLVQTIPAGGSALITCILLTGTTAASWSSVYTPAATSAGAISLPTITGGLLSAGSATVAPLTFTQGTNLTSPVAGANEFDGASFYNTIDTSSGRGAIPVEQFFRLTAAGTTISTIANYFGANSNISLVASAFYEIEIYAWFLNTTSGTVVWTLTNSAAPTSQNIYYEMSPITGIVAPPGTATMLVGQIPNDTTAAKALAATGNLTDAVNHFMHMKIYLQNGTGTNLKIQATKSAGSITPGVGSYWKCRRLPATSTGTFAA